MIHTSPYIGDSFNDVASSRRGLLSFRVDAKIEENKDGLSPCETRTNSDHLPEINRYKIGTTDKKSKTNKVNTGFVFQ